MQKLNPTLTALIVMALFILAAIGIYQVFFTPPEELPDQSIRPIDTYFGEDVLEFITDANEST